MMRTVQGLGISAGIAIGPVFSYEKSSLEVKAGSVEDPAAERASLAAAIETARRELQVIVARASNQGMQASELDIFNAHLLILDDPELLDQVYASIDGDCQNAAYAWRCVTDHYADLFAAMQDEYFAARAADVRDVAERVLRILAGKAQANTDLLRPSIVVADDLTPSDTVSFDRGKVLAFCTARGGPTSHVAILSKALGIPAVTGLGAYLPELISCREVIVDGDDGKVVLEPDEYTRQEYLRLKESQTARFQAAFAHAHEAALTKDGQQVEVVANIGSAADTVTALEFGAEGVGLLRTEFLFLDRSTPPGEEEQVAIYREILDAFGKRPVVARTLDIGGDKPAPYLPIQPELNPFLGVRGARLGLAFPDVLETQLRALLRAGAGCNIKIMFPMVSTLNEIQVLRQTVHKAQADLAARGQGYAREAEIGIMVEVPSAAIMADILAPAVDFFSIGTNDLSQYTLAADRTNQGVARLADALDPAVLRLISIVCRAAHQRGIWVGLCGEMAGDAMAAPLLLGLGVDEFSMNPRAIPFVKEAIRRFTGDRAREIADQALGLASAEEVRQYLRQFAG